MSYVFIKVLTKLFLCLYYLYMESIEKKEDIQLYKDMIENLDLQLRELYAEKEYLEKTIGTSDAVTISQMILSMQQQLEALYEEKKDMIVIEGNTIIIPSGSKIYIKKGYIKKS